MTDGITEDVVRAFLLIFLEEEYPFPQAQELCRCFPDLLQHDELLPIAQELLDIKDNGRSSWTARRMIRFLALKTDLRRLKGLLLKA